MKKNCNFTNGMFVKRFSLGKAKGGRGDCLTVKINNNFLYIYMLNTKITLQRKFRKKKLYIKKKRFHTTKRGFQVFIHCRNLFFKINDY
jgi:ribosomal protein L21E